MAYIDVYDDLYSDIYGLDDAGPLPPPPVPSTAVPVQIAPPRPRLTVSTKVQTASGLWLELNDRISYRIAAGSFEDETVSMRRTTAPSVFLPGEHVVDAVEDNIITPVNVYVYGQSEYQLETNVALARDAFKQPVFQLRRTIDDSVRVYSCFASDHTVNRPKELVHAHMAMLRVQLLHLPGVLLEEAL